MSLTRTGKSINQSSIKLITGRGKRIQAQVKEIRVDSVTFEVLGLDSVLQISEILRDVEIEIEGKLAYRGELSVSGLVPLGVMVVCEARLSGPWLLDSFGSEEFLENIAKDLEEHTVQWAESQEIRPLFRSVVADLETYLSGLESWCDRVECGALSNREDSSERERRILAELGPIVSLEIKSHFADYERVVSKLDAENRHIHRNHLMKAAHRFILQSPFSYRCFTKPLGYAGDYGMVNLMLGSPYQGATLFGKLLNYAFMQTGPVVAHRNRIDYLVGTLGDVAKKRADRGLRTRILNLGCGPAEEVQRFIESNSVSEFCDFELLDFNPETLRYTAEQLDLAKQKGEREVNTKLIEESVQNFLKQASRGESYPKESYDLVYCAGLFDYLQQRFCAKLTAVMFDLVKNGGKAVVTNVSRDNTIPAVMSDFLEWTLIERTQEEMMDLVPKNHLSVLKELKSDSTHINLFLELTKSEALHRDVEPTHQSDTAEGHRPEVFGTLRGRRGYRESSQL